jgi:hypothetical protein
MLAHQHTLTYLQPVLLVDSHSQRRRGVVESNKRRSDRRSTVKPSFDGVIPNRKLSGITNVPSAG